MLEELLNAMTGNEASIEGTPGSGMGALMTQLLDREGQARPTLDEWINERTDSATEQAFLQQAIGPLTAIQGLIDTTQNPIERTALSAGLASLLDEVYQVRNTAVMIAMRVLCLTGGDEGKANAAISHVVDLVGALYGGIAPRVEAAKDDAELQTKLQTKHDEREARWNKALERCDNDRGKAFLLNMTEEAILGIPQDAEPETADVPDTPAEPETPAADAAPEEDATPSGDASVKE
jgi:hypothetical protein